MATHAAPPFAAPVVAWHHPDDPTTPLVVLLHGRGADERSILGLANRLPAGPTYAAVRAPIAEGGGYAWFANRGIGRPVADSLTATMSWFRHWLDEVAVPGRPVLLVGFSGGAAFAGGLVLDDPDRVDGTAVLYGTLPFDAGVPTTPGRLTGRRVLLARGIEDHVIPHDLQYRTWTYLHDESGAELRSLRSPGGHGISPMALQALGEWIHATVDTGEGGGR